MKRMRMLFLSLLLAVAALSAVVAIATVEWLVYPTAGAPVASTPPPSESVKTTQPLAAQTPPSQAPAGPDEALALDFVRRAGAGDLAGALSLTAPSVFKQEQLRTAVARFSPAPVRAGKLPGTPTVVLVWTQYRNEVGAQARGLYQVTVSGGKVTALAGPIAPDNGFHSLSLEPLDEQARPVDMAAYKGHSLLLVAPRNPEDGLLEALKAMPPGIDVVLVRDIRSPDWVGSARQGGFTGPVWLVKSRLEDLPVVSQTRFLGAVGILVDRDGYAVGSFAALDPLRYNLPDSTLKDVAPLVLKAYGLLP